MKLPKKAFVVDVADQSREIPHSGGARESKLNPSGVFTDYLFDDTRTVAEVPLRGLKVSNNGPFLGWRDSKPEYRWLSYQEVIDRYRFISYGLVQIGMKPGQDTFVGMYAKNCVEWVLVEQACHSQSVIPVPLYDSLGPSACTFILNHVEAETMVCDTEERARKLLDVREDVPKMCRIVIMQDILGEDVKNLAREKGVTLHTLKDVEDLGKKNVGILKLPRPEDLATVCYTSGTTGTPKGVMLTHANLVANLCGFSHNLAPGFLSASDRYLSYLPLAHMFERMSHLLLMSVGGCIGFSRGDVNLLVDDFRALQPTIMAAVPRILNRIFDKVRNQASTSKLKRFLLEAALRAKRAELDRGIIRNDSVWDRLVLKNVRNVLGGQVRMLVTAGAPVRDEVISFFRCCMGCPVLQAYGQTESTAGCTCTVIGDNTPGVVGPPLSCCSMKLVDVPDMGYLAANNEGEILVKGPIVFRGYFKDPQRTSETVDEDGWLHTGDIGRWTERGSLAVIDRKKDLLKLSQGEYVSPEKVESVYLGSSCVDQIFVHGDSLQSFLVAVVVPDRAALESHCAAEGIVIKEEWPKTCENEDVQLCLCRHLYKLGNEAGLKGFEQVKAVHLEAEPFSLENGLLTPTLKMKRTECKKRFKTVIRDMYRI